MVGVNATQASRQNRLDTMTVYRRSTPMYVIAFEDVGVTFRYPRVESSSCRLTRPRGLPERNAYLQAGSNISRFKLRLEGFSFYGVRAVR
jgi:hypothetical protein